MFASFYKIKLFDFPHYCVSLIKYCFIMSNISEAKLCILRSRNYKFRDVQLPDQTPVLIGRGPQTKIREHKCSKIQVEVKADYKLKKAVLRQLGGNPSEVDNKLLCSQESVDIFEGSSVNLIQGDLKYTLEFLEAEPNRSKHRSPKTLEAHFKPEDNVFNSSSSTSIESDSTKRNAEIDFAANKKAKQDEDINRLPDEALRQSITSTLDAIPSSLANDLLSLTTEDSWEEYDHSKLLMFQSTGLKASTTVAAFDLDHTIISTKSGKVFPTSTDDWKIIYSEVPGKLKKLFADGFKILIFTNQKGISKGKTSVPEFKRKVQSIVRKLGIPVQVLVSTGSGKYRKPNTGMWDYFVKHGNQDVIPDISSCIYVGDAAGRLENWAPKKKKDFSCADRLFALNVGLKFYTPEEFFLSYRPAAFKMPLFDPRTAGSKTLAVKCQPSSSGAVALDESGIVSSTLEVVIFVGFPASGKTHFAKTYLVPKGYHHINRDTLGTWQKCVLECKKALDSGRKVVIDNTNPDAESRMRYIECAKQHKVPCRCFLFNCSLDQAKHNNVFRELQNPEEKHGVNDMVMNSYKSKFKEPSISEGFSEILKINFVPKFRNRHEAKLYERFLIEK